jgi:hypothetical protein
VINAIRSLSEAQRAAAYSPQHAVVVRGTQAQLRLTEWLVGSMDAGGSGTRATDFDDQSKIPVEFHATAVRVFYLAPESTPQSMQELTNAIRSVSELQRVVVYVPEHAILARGTPGQIKLAEWLVAQLEAATPGPGMRATVFEDDHAPPPYRATAVRIFNLPPAATAEVIQETVNRLRRDTKAPRVVAYVPRLAIVLRGTDAQAAEAERVMQ